MSFKSSFTIPAVAAISFCLIGGTSPAAADILHVPGDFPTIQAAIDAAVDGDEVEVHPGTYNETINFLGKAIRVYSSDGPDVTIIDAQQTGTVVTCDSAEGPDSVLEGFTITGGNAGLGGGMRNINSSPTVTNCTFSQNTAVNGGGMYNDSSSPTVNNCTFSGNFVDYDGAGMYTLGGSADLIDCTFEGNTAGYPSYPGSGGGLYYGSGAGRLSVTNCSFVGNLGGGLFHGSGTLSLTNCSFLYNTWGYGVVTYGSSSLINCTFRYNQSPHVVLGIYVSGSSSLLNCSFIDRITVHRDAEVTLANCIARYGPVGINGPATVTFSNVKGGWPGEGNIDADPLFVDLQNGDLHLSPGSPCIDAGNNWGVPVDELDYDGDGILCELFPVDLDGNPRFNADEADFDPGCGVPVVVDMGAYEYQFDPADQVTFADLNGDDAVGVADLLGLLASWGPCAKGCCLADLDLDGNVGVSDLLALLANWGPCP